MNTKNDLFQELKSKIKNLVLRWTSSIITTHSQPKKNVAVYFKDVKTEQTFRSQDQKLMETTNLWQFYWDKNTTAQIRWCDHYISRND